MINYWQTNQMRLLTGSLFFAFTVGLIVGCSVTPLANGKDGDGKHKKGKPTPQSGIPTNYYLSASPIVLHIVVRNSHDHEMKFIDDNIETAFSFSVKDSSGKAVPLTRYGDHLLNPPRRLFSTHSYRLYLLKKGEKQDYRILLNRIYDMSVSGIYSVSVSKKVDLGPKDIVVTSKPVKIEVGGFDGSEPSPDKDYSVKVDTQ